MPFLSRKLDAISSGPGEMLTDQGCDPFRLVEWDQYIAVVNHPQPAVGERLSELASSGIPCLNIQPKVTGRRRIERNRRIARSASDRAPGIRPRRARLRPGRPGG